MAISFRPVKRTIFHEIFIFVLLLQQSYLVYNYGMCVFGKNNLPVLGGGPFALAKFLIYIFLPLNTSSKENQLYKHNGYLTTNRSHQTVYRDHFG